ncbi:UNVERIFIED_CONTAM: hypothetical protein FKN15_068947 [Acipenser sinensis]
MVDLEDRNRRNNLRLISLKEGAEGSDTIDFLTKSLVHSLSPASADRTHSDGMKKVGSAVQHLSQSLSWHLDLFTR